MKASAEMLKTFFPLADSWKLEGGLNFWRQACGAHGGWEVTSGFLCMCAVCSPQALTCGFNPLYEDRLPPLICTLSPHEPSMVSLYLSHQLYLGSLSCISGISLPVFYLANNFFPPTVSPFFSLIKSAPPPSAECISWILWNVVPPERRDFVTTGFFVTSHCLEGVMLKTSFFFFCFLCVCE